MTTYAADRVVRTDGQNAFTRQKLQAWPLVRRIGIVVVKRVASYDLVVRNYTLI